MVMFGRSCITRYKVMQFSLQGGCCSGTCSRERAEMVVIMESPIDLMVPAMLDASCRCSCCVGGRGGSRCTYWP